MNYLVTLAFVAILGCLGMALFFMLRGGANTAEAKAKRMANALAMRVGFSVLLFVCILLAWKLGYIAPTGLPLSK